MSSTLISCKKTFHVAPGQRESNGVVKLDAADRISHSIILFNALYLHPAVLSQWTMMLMLILYAIKAKCKW